MTTADRDDSRETWWNARVAALEAAFGEMVDVVGHAPIPFQLGPDAGGAADIVYFKNHVAGVLAVTSELIGCDQVANALGNYELAICTRGDEAWATDLISRLAYYTLDATLDPGETMDIGPAVPRGASIRALLFSELARFTVRGRPAGVLLCLGITKDELKACRAGRRDVVESELRRTGVYPFSYLQRKSVALPKLGKGWW